MSSMIRNWGR